MGIAYAPLTATERTTARHKWTWQRPNETNLSLTIPITPLPTNQQETTAAAKINTQNPWDATSD